MSSHKRIVLSPEAVDDYDHILLYTLETWGERQMEVYESQLGDAIELIAKYQDLGKRRLDLPENVRIFQVQHHLIVYRIKEDRLEIARILHEKMDAGKHL